MPFSIPNSVFTKGLSSPVVGLLPINGVFHRVFHGAAKVFLSSFRSWAAVARAGYGVRASGARKNKEGTLQGKTRRPHPLPWHPHTWVGGHFSWGEACG